VASAQQETALTSDDIPALVKTGVYCVSNPAPPDPTTIGVLSVQPPFTRLPQGIARVPSGLKPSNRLIADTKTVINPAAIPSGTELFFGYSSSGYALFFQLIYSHFYTCDSGQPPATP
jgi:hypothetical protein